ncbi:hypothetical protein G4B88_000817 [Cannabis sativa]|uniref:Chalcone-flavonone isomerase family protein n=1 Tax=Cannabis sativa TaxID=3483 RepID=A0A7J6I409_CANSA|nr:hypothetical protein G4B88_000817 [Cannabis sativa]
MDEPNTNAFSSYHCKDIPSNYSIILNTPLSPLSFHFGFNVETVSHALLLCSRIGLHIFRRNIKSFWLCWSPPPPESLKLNVDVVISDSNGTMEASTSRGHSLAQQALGLDCEFVWNGVRALEIQGNLVKFTSIGVYLEDSAVTWLSGKWKGKTSEELTESVEFFREIVTGPFHKFTRITMILPLTGKQYSEKVAENCVAIWKSLGIYSDAEAKAIDKFLEIFKDENFLPGSSILFTQSPNGFLKISFSKDESIPETWVSEIESKLLSEAILESIIGKNGVSPAARQSIASTLSKLLKENNGSTNDHKAAGEIDGDINLKATKAYKDKDVISIPIENGNGKHKVTNE